MICARGLRSGPEENEREEYLQCAQCGLTWVRDGRLGAWGDRRSCEGVGSDEKLHGFIKPAQNEKKNAGPRGHEFGFFFHTCNEGVR